MSEFLGDEPPLGRSRWIGDLWGEPTASSVASLQQVLNQYGACHVTIAPASREGYWGIYVRGDVLVREKNWLHSL